MSIFCEELGGTCNPYYNVCTKACSDVLPLNLCGTLSLFPTELVGPNGIFNTLFATAQAAAESFPLVIDGIGTTVQDELTKLFYRVAIVQGIPYLVVFIVLFIVLMRSNVISTAVGIMLIMFIIVMTVIGIAFILFYTEDVVDNVVTNIQNGVYANLAANKETIICNLSGAWVGCIGCTGTGSVASSFCNKTTTTSELLDNLEKIAPQETASKRHDNSAKFSMYPVVSDAKQLTINDLVKNIKK